MAKTSLLWRIGRSAKDALFDIERAGTEKRIKFSRKQVKRRDSKKKKRIDDAGFELMTADSGLTRKELEDKASHFRTFGICDFSNYEFRAYGLYKMDDEQAKKTLAFKKSADQLEEDLNWDFRLIDLGKLTYEDVSDKIQQFKDNVSHLLTMDAKKEIALKAGYLHPENMSDEEIDDLVRDMEFTRCILQFGHGEYARFHFKDKSITERRGFVSDRERNRLLSAVNSDTSIAVFDDKMMTYEKLSEFYGRDMISVNSEKDYFKFRNFFEKNEKAVIKPRFDSLGKGIKLINRSEIDNYGKYFLGLVDEYRRFLMEGFIEAADEIKTLNPDSVNTVRVIAYYDGKNTSIRNSSMRIGHAGSFVDNAGAGGITVSVDKETGVINSDGCDENGFRYEKHPDTGVTLKGYQLPAWDKALEVVYAVSGRIEGARYVGWDLACTADHEWVLVEANGKTGFFGAQAPYGKGRRSELLETIGADPRGELYNEIARRMAKKVRDANKIPVEETMNRLSHFESLGLDGRYYRPYRAWELSDAECLELKEALEGREAYGKKREQDVCRLISAKYGLDEEDVRRKYRLALKEGYKEFWFLADGIFMLTDDEIKAHTHLRVSEAEDDWERDKKKKLNEIKKKIREKKHWSKGKYSLEQLKARNNCGCAADEFIVMRMYDRSPEEAREFITAEVKHKAWLINACTYEDSMKLRSKISFSDTFSEFTDRIVFSNRDISLDDFEEKIKGLEQIVYKPEEGDKGLGIKRFHVNGASEENKAVYESLMSLEPGVVEEFLYQHPDMAAFYPDAVNTVRVITALKDDKACVVMAALRTGRYGNTDNWSQGGLSAGINVKTGTIETDGVDQYGERYADHPVTGKTFFGAKIPEWDKIERNCCEAARKCPDIPLIGWDAAVLRDGRVVLIEGNLSFGTKSIQTPFSLADVGLRERFEQFLQQ